MTVVSHVIGYLEYKERKMGLILWIIVGVIAGWLTGQVMSGHSYGVLGDLVIGIVGGIIGGWLFGILGLSAAGIIGEILMAAAGGVVLVALLRALRRA